LPTPVGYEVDLSLEPEYPRPDVFIVRTSTRRTGMEAATMVTAASAAPQYTITVTCSAIAVSSVKGSSKVRILGAEVLTEVSRGHCGNHHGLDDGCYSGAIIEQISGTEDIREE
jgi:hypothetical protein